MGAVTHVPLLLAVSPTLLFLLGFSLDFPPEKTK